MVCIPWWQSFPKDPARPIGSLKTAWNNVRKKAESDTSVVISGTYNGSTQSAILTVTSGGH